MSRSCQKGHIRVLVLDRYHRVLHESESSVPAGQVTSYDDLGEQPIPVTTWSFPKSASRRAAGKGFWSRSGTVVDGDMSHRHNQLYKIARDFDVMLFGWAGNSVYPPR